MEVRGQLHALATFPIGKRASDSHWIGADWAPELGMEWVWELKLGHPAYSQSLLSYGG